MARKAKAPTLPDLLRIEYVLLEAAVAWEKNPKKHDFGALWQSIQKHGFLDPPKFDAKLNSGHGAIVEGNGRSHVLREMKAAGEPAPRGIEVDAEGQWLMPILFGVDAESERAAEAYGVDHNNLTLGGGDFGPSDYARLWDESGYTELLADLANDQELPITVDGDDVDALIGRLTNEGGGGGASGSYDSFEQEQKIVKSDKGDKPTFGVLVPCEGEGDQRETYQRLRDEGYEVVMFGAKPPGVGKRGSKT